MTDWCRTRSDARSFFTELDALLRRWDPLSHPFYIHWSDGELPESAFVGYVCQYEHITAATAAGARRVADIASPAINADLGDYAEDCAAAARHWQRFREAIGGAFDASPRAETVCCARACSPRVYRRLEATLALHYALASTASRVAFRLRHSLAGRDVIAPGATTHLHLYARRQHGHARRARQHLEPRLDRAIAAELLECVDAALADHWQLLSALDVARDEVLV